MGSERKSKDKSRRRASDSQSEDEGERKRHRRSIDEHAEGSRKRDKKEKFHHKRDSEKERKSEKKHKHKHSKHDRQSDPKFKELCNEDYFLKNNEFATWLKEEKNKFFSDLSSESAREMFSEFVEVWNSKKLRSKYYKGIKTGPRSSHEWKIKD